MPMTIPQEREHIERQHRFFARVAARTDLAPEVRAYAASAAEHAAALAKVWRAMAPFTRINIDAETERRDRLYGLFKLVPPL